MQMDKTYDPAAIEDRIYSRWLEKKYFHAEVDRSKKPFTIVMPPPNITGQLHMGHALDNTMQDILIRYRRMQGYEALWQPGTDHASIATEVKIINQLKSEGIDKETLGREKFLERAWKWRDEYGSRIITQLKKMGSSADWDRERFTMDEGCSKAVQEVFLKLHKKGYIYKGSRIINWCPVCKTSISDAEVEHVDQQGHFWHIRYPITDRPGEYIEVATTRPETMLGDTAIAVNPDDERYTDLVGKTCILPLVNKEIPIIADPYVDKEFGTGAVKITPAHDPNDFEVGKRHGLEEINILNDDATVNENGGKYAGMDRYEARKAVVKDLEEQGYLTGIEDLQHSVGTHDRCGTTVEPMIKPQWFVRMDELAKPAIEAIEKGTLKFVPERFNNTYLNWLTNIRDWCISRQLWWGHRIPAYYCDQCGHTVVAAEMPEVCPECGCTHFTQDPDTLDTWFSSALWPFSTLGWPEKTEELEYFYPTDVLVTGYDIIFFWVVRMVFSGLEHMGEVPFNTVLIHGLVRDELGRKMSKSLGNGIDPLEVIDKYGADALRLTLVTGNAPGNDMRFSWKKVEASRNFANKVWNASRFILMNFEQARESGLSWDNVPEESLTQGDRWMLCKANRLIREVTENLDKYELGIAVSKVYDFVWEEFCDWYIEMAKPRLYNSEDETRPAALWTLKTVLIIALKLLHPYMPFITEEIFMNLQDEEESIMISQWPLYRDEWNYTEDEEEVELIKEAVRGIREIRRDLNVPLARRTRVYVVSDEEEVRDIFTKGKVFFASLGHASEVTVQADRSGIRDDAASVIIHQAGIYIPLEELVDIDKEIQRLEKDRADTENEIKRAESLLENPNFTSKAPEAKVQAERDKLEKYTGLLIQIAERLETLKNR
ncbi:MAG: valine--tRNA ligase [Lachnospiraceae bacterium]|nr:valine--tRNA ligase [Lachnospiraceae bacterium]